MSYGFQRLVLLNSAGYQRAELPLDASVSLVAPNNTGKTSLINALQFLLIIDRRRMDFGAYDVERSRRFYFPHNSAYILLEVLLPESGSVVLGCVGKGVSHDYEYFAYRGPLDLDDFRVADGSLVTQPQLLAHLAGRGRLAERYSGSEFTSMVYGSGRRQRGDQSDFTVFRLEQASQAEVFQRVLTRTLRLDRLQSKEVKDYLLQIFSRDLPDAGIDFKQEWDKAFADVNADRSQYLAALSQRERISQLEKLHEERLQLRGKLSYFRPLIDQALLDWQAYYQSQSAELRRAREAVELAEERLQRELLDWAAEQERGRQREASLQAEDQRQAELEQRFVLIDRRQQLVQAVTVARSEYERQVALVTQAQDSSLDQIRRECRRVQQDLDRTDRELASLASNLYQHLQRELDELQLAAVNRLLARETMMLAEDEFSLDGALLRRSLEHWLRNPEYIELPGLCVQLASLPVQHRQRSADEIREEQAELRQSLAQLNEQLRAAEAMREAQLLKQQLEHDYQQTQRDLEAFDQLVALREVAGERAQSLQDCRAALQRLEERLVGTQGETRRLREQLKAVNQRQEELDRQHREICTSRERRNDSDPLFGYLSELPQHPWVGSSELALEQLAEHLREYLQDCNRLVRIEGDVRTLRAELHGGGLTKYQSADDPDSEIGRIIEFAQHLPQEFEAIERKARTAVVNVTACLRQLRDGLHAFKGRMRQFNQLIGRRRLSDLDVFKIEPEDERELVEAIEALISTAEQVDSGQTFELFDHGSVLDDETLNRAKMLLIREGEARGRLAVEHLFRLNFIVGKEGRSPEAFADIDGAASNGTVLMAKLVTGLALLHQMQDKRHAVRAACYLDEALALDGPNQTSLIDTAAEFGFSLIFASPAPLATARYCVPISRHNGHNQISRRSWQLLEPKEPEVVA
ncbi:hypothetical protein ACIGFL_04070 [Pseudomonas sp. NPDC077649]|uniref:hypothetical protein n=1 Tax=Pseudomonas sp. NPDC077649 TaxID=3364423 RepID=UPI0037C725F0